MPRKRTPVIVIHNLAHARAAAAAAVASGVPVRLRSAPGAARYAGAGWFAAVIAIVRAEFPSARIEGSLDCAGDAGYALAGLRAGIGLVRFTGPRAVARKLAAIAKQHGGALDDAPLTVDLLDETDPDARVRAALTRR